MSTTYISNLVALLAFGLPVVGVHITDQSQVVADITNVVGVAALIYTFYGRYKAGGISAFGFRIGN